MIPKPTYKTIITGFLVMEFAKARDLRFEISTSLGTPGSSVENQKTTGVWMSFLVGVWVLISISYLKIFAIEVDIFQIIFKYFIQVISCETTASRLKQD